jgi:hypothetical protein
MTDALQSYRRPFRLGASDCATCAADAFAAAHGFDPLAPLRGSYSRPRDVARLVRDAGGWVALGDRLAAKAGMRRAAGHAVGAMAVCRWGRQTVVAVGDADGWVTRAPKGYAVLPPGCEVAAWQR